MKSLKGFVVAAVVLSSFPVLAQQADANVQQSTSASAGNKQVDQSTNANASASRHGASAQGSGNASASSPRGSAAASGMAAGAAEMRPVNGELVGKLDSKTAKVGDPVIVKTTEKARTAEGTEIPKGSRLIGHVTQVQAHGNGSQDSYLGLQFDRAELKNGQSMGISSVIQSLSPSAAAMNAAAAGNDDMFASGPAGGGAVAGGGRGGLGGGALGGGAGLAGGAGAVAGGTVRSAGSLAGNAGSAVGSSAGAAMNGTANTAVNAGQGSLNGAVSGTGAMAAHATAIPGVMLAGDATGSASGMLSASKKNVHLDSGTLMVLAVSSAVSK
jgi:hypothetical protein